MKAELTVNTCLFGIEKLDRILFYRERFGDALGWEILPMFERPEYVAALQKLVPHLTDCAVSFHEPVFGVEHSVKKGSMADQRTTVLLERMLPYVEQLHAGHVTMHFNNRVVYQFEKKEMLENALRNYEELKARYEAIGSRLLVENTGTKAQRNVLLSEEEFIELCVSRDMDVLIDLGHAHANGWDLPRVFRALKDRIFAFHIHNNDGAHDLHSRIGEGTMDLPAVLSLARKEVPDAEWILEYTDPKLEGEALVEDIETLLALRNQE